MVRLPRLGDGGDAAEGQWGAPRTGGAQNIQTTPTGVYCYCHPEDEGSCDWGKIIENSAGALDYEIGSNSLAPHLATGGCGTIVSQAGYPQYAAEASACVSDPANYCLYRVSTLHGGFRDMFTSTMTLDSTVSYTGSVDPSFTGEDGNPVSGNAFQYGTGDTLYSVANQQLCSAPLDDSSLTSCENLDPDEGGVTASGPSSDETGDILPYLGP